ncbi:N-acetyldiaminopimelate deacetylase [Bacillus marinisedimentorum]|uniref:N-acetyldiaminopimelate deacetylase n=1 Tax=Bacillus marinisedimentorum TaxID=1821260 RepID=UPI0008730DAA|nr:N-acetyldiaminopimelate deacetylase [Bacillus marinisedimentorum]
MKTDELITLRRKLHQIPEIGFQEKKTQQLLLERISEFPQDRVEIKTWRTGIFVKVKGSNPSRCIGYRADIDGLPITEETGYPYASQHDGFMHACGHDFHMTIAMGVLSRVVSEPIADDLLFIFQPAEEGPGGAVPMLASSIMEEWRPDIVLALHIAPEYPAGTIAVKEGLLFANTSELFIDLKGKGGHAAYPHQTNDMVVAASHLVTQLQTIVSRNINPLDSAVVTIGKITGGTVQNVIAETARLEGTIRTLSSDTMTIVKNRIETLLNGIAAGFSCSYELDYGSNYYQVYNEERLTRSFMDFIDNETPYDLVECRTAMTGEDFGYMLKEIPGFMFWLGVGSESGLHSSTLKPDEKAIGIAVDAIFSYIKAGIPEME